MQIFISWSGTPARELADFLQTWLQRVIQELEPFMSKNSIEKGARWSPQIAKRLEETTQAIVCVTQANQSAEWLNFEAGALAKATESRVRTLLIDVTPSDVTGPLSEFQHTIAASKEDVYQLMLSINSHCDRPLDESLIESTFEREWQSFEEKLKSVVAMTQNGPASSGKAGKRERKDPDLLAEIVDRVRGIERAASEDRMIIHAILEQLVGPRFDEPTPSLSDALSHITVSQRRKLDALAHVIPGTIIRIRAGDNGEILAKFREFKFRGKAPYVLAEDESTETKMVVPLDEVIGPLTSESP